MGICVHEVCQIFAPRAADATNCWLVIHQENFNHLQTSFLLKEEVVCFKTQVPFVLSFPKTKIRDIYRVTVIGGLIRGLTCGAFAFSFALMQKKQKIKENTIAPRVFPCLRAAKAGG